MKNDEDQCSFTFEKGGPGSLFLRKGWEYPEIWGVKNSDTVCEILFPQTTVDTEGEISLNFWCCCRSETLVLMNGNCVATWLPDNSFSERAVKIPNAGGLVFDKPNVIQFQTGARRSLDLVSVWIQGGKFYKSPCPVLRQDILDPSGITHAPVFITGIPRSGTSITYKIICDLLGVKNSSMIESFFFSWAFSGFQDSFAGDCANAFLGEELSGVFNIFRIENFPTPDYYDLITLTRKYFELASERQQSPRVVEKTPENIFYWKLILSSFPRSKIIFCIRPALDVFSSIKKRFNLNKSKYSNTENKEWLSVDIDDFICQYNEYILAAKSLQLKNCNAFFLLDYDRLVSRDSECLQALAFFLDCDPASIYLALDAPIEKSKNIDVSMKSALHNGVLINNRINAHSYLEKDEIKKLSGIIGFRG